MFNRVLITLNLLGSNTFLFVSFLQQVLQFKCLMKLVHQQTTYTTKYHLEYLLLFDPKTLQTNNNLVLNLGVINSLHV